MDHFFSSSFFISFLFLFLTITTAPTTCQEIQFPISSQPTEIQEAFRRRLATYFPKDFHLPRNMDLIPFVDCVAEREGKNPPINRVINRLENYTKKRFMEEMLRCIGSSSPARVADRLRKRGDGRIEMFFIRLRYTLWAYLNQLKKQQKGKRPRSPLEAKSIGPPLESPLASPEVDQPESLISTTSAPSSSSSPSSQVGSQIQPVQPLVSVQIGRFLTRPRVHVGLKLRPTITNTKDNDGSVNKIAGSLVSCDQLEAGCVYEDELDGLGGVVVGALEDIGKSINRFTGGLRRFHGDLKRFVNSGTNLLIG